MHYFFVDVAARKVVILGSAAANELEMSVGQDADA